MPSNNNKHDSCIAERYEISSSCVAGAVSNQGRSEHMEDEFKIISNINGTDVSLFGIFDGHAGRFAAEYCADIILPCISQKICEVMNLINQKLQKIRDVKNQQQKENNSDSETTQNEDDDAIEEDPLNRYITVDNKVDYELLMHEEILNQDAILIERMSRAALFCGSTFCVVLIDITNKLIICANVGDSRAVLCDNRGRALALSQDHKPNNLKEMERIRDNGGYISNKEGCWRVEGTLAVSRAIGDYPFKAKKLIIAEPDIRKIQYSDFKYFPKYIVIASDGMWDVFTNQEACDYVKEKLKETHCGARSLMKKAYAKRSSDNISVILIKFIKPKKPKYKPASFDPYVGTYEWLR